MFVCLSLLCFVVVVYLCFCFCFSQPFLIRLNKRAEEEDMYTGTHHYVTEPTTNLSTDRRLSCQMRFPLYRGVLATNQRNCSKVPLGPLHRIKGSIGETSERRGGAHMGFSERKDTILN